MRYHSVNHALYEDDAGSYPLSDIPTHPGFIWHHAWLGRLGSVDPPDYYNREEYEHDLAQMRYGDFKTVEFWKCLTCGKVTNLPRQHQCEN